MLNFATLSAERAPFVAPRHFPRFIGEIYPEGGSEVSTALYFKKKQNVTNYEND